ncbi:winged helix-turn-helix transcriptional regulator [Rhodococcus tibetensis]|uniref:Response regulator transcription factor n=1 Tax=Rhodococcus tibetensis TaxID=2965064 RepID=A0ABT1QI29_9NOCA|nr:response regulator transcription factor [Rhodococcus sp. FXJ9.536]MCQ4121852.1 response regulator transcription factor [Rhodococcus sp. FXJ9.536]
MYSFADHCAVPGRVLALPSAESRLVGRLRAAGVHVQIGSALLSRAELVRLADVVIVDARSRNVEQLDTIRALRACGAGTGILVIDEFANEEIRCSYFEAGADDVMSFPVNIDEVIARLRALLRRLGPSRSSSNSPTLSGIAVNTDNAVLQVGTTRIALSKTELDVVVVLAKDPGLVVRRGHLLQKVWGLPADSKSNVLNTCIYLLRRKLESHGAPDVIETVRGVGFRLTPESDDRPVAAVVAHSCHNTAADGPRAAFSLSDTG